MGLGSQRIFSLKEARERARKARQLLADGTDPLNARAEERALRALESARKISFAMAADAYFKAHAPSWKNAKHAAQFMSTLNTYVFPHIGNLSVADINTGLVLKCLEPIWADKTETAGRVRGRIESVLDWATVRGYRKGDNPARWKGHLSEVLPSRAKLQKKKHHAALPFVELPQFMTALMRREGVAARALEFTILTAARTGETIGALWEEIDLNERTWTILPERMKAGKQHRVPLCSRAIEILNELPRETDNPFVFIGSRRNGLSNMAMTATLQRMQCEDITVHGFRSSFRDWAAERTNFANHIVEMALAHTVSDKVEAAYRRGDLFAKRARLMTEWARFTASVGQEPRATVVALRANSFR